MGLAKQHRIVEPRRFTELFQSRGRRVTEDFTLRFLRNDRDYFRVGLVLAKKKSLGPWTAIKFGAASTKCCGGKRLGFGASIS